MALRHTGLAWRAVRRLNLRSAVVLLALAQRIRAGDDWSGPIGTLAKACGLSSRSVGTALHELCELGLVEFSHGQRKPRADQPIRWWIRLRLDEPHARKWLGLQAERRATPRETYAPLDFSDLPPGGTPKP